MGASLLAALPGLIPILLPHLVPAVVEIFDRYAKKEITRDQLEAEVRKALIDGFAKIDVAQAESIAKTYASFMEAASHSRLIATIWAIVVLAELAVLIWHQVGISALVFITGRPWPSSGNTVEWAYALLLLTMGGGAAILRTGPTSGAGLVDRLKSLVKIR